MNLKQIIDTIINTELSAGNSFTFAWGIFLDTFNSANTELKVSIIKDKPTCLDFDQRLASFLASSVHRLCNLNNLSDPPWIHDPEYILKDPFFLNNPPDPLKLIYLMESPPEYKCRNIFVSENVLTRV
jgi:hypothetical protein